MKYLVGVAGLWFLMACQPQAKDPSKHPTDSVIATASRPKAPDTTTLAGQWYLQAVLPSDTAAGKTPSIQLDVVKSRFAGNTGCNSMHGEFFFSKNDSSISFGDKIVTTKMACTGYNEAAFLKSLQKANHYRLDGGVLTFLAEDNSELSRWMRKPNAQPKALKA